MSFLFFLSRPGLCAGTLPLYQLLRKLARSGQHKAVRALCDLPVDLSMTARVRWSIRGTALALEVAA